MIYAELIEKVKRYYNFSPDEKFTTLSHVLNAGKKRSFLHDLNQGYIAMLLAQHIDQLEREKYTQ